MFVWLLSANWSKIILRFCMLYSLIASFNASFKLMFFTWKSSLAWCTDYIKVIGPNTGCIDACMWTINIAHVWILPLLSNNLNTIEVFNGGNGDRWHIAMQEGRGTVILWICRFFLYQSPIFCKPDSLSQRWKWNHSTSVFVYIFLLSMECTWCFKDSIDFHYAKCLGFFYFICFLKRSPKAQTMGKDC